MKVYIFINAMRGHSLALTRAVGAKVNLQGLVGLLPSYRRELANRCESTIGAVVDAANVGVARIRTEQLAFSFLGHTPLSF